MKQRQQGAPATRTTRQKAGRASSAETPASDPVADMMAQIRDWTEHGLPLLRLLPGFVSQHDGRVALEALGLPATATEDDVRRAARREAKRVHPDVGGSPEAFIRMRETVKKARRHVTQRRGVRPPFEDEGGSR